MTEYTGPRLIRASAIAEAIRDTLEDADLAAVVVTIDGREVPQWAPDGAVVILPPRLTFPTYDSTTVAFEVVVTAGPADQHLAAWDRMDQIIAAIAPGMDFRDAEPASFQPNAGPVLPAYTLTYDDPE